MKPLQRPAEANLCERPELAFGDSKAATQDGAAAAAAAAEAATSTSTEKLFAGANADHFSESDKQACATGCYLLKVFASVESSSFQLKEIAASKT